MPLTELLADLGLEGRTDEIVAWARTRADEILASAPLDAELAEVLGGNGAAHAPVYVARDHTAPGNTQPGVPLPKPPNEPRAPLPPVPQRPDLAAQPGDEVEDLEMLDEDDLELVEDLGGDDEEEPSDAGENGAAAQADGDGEPTAGNDEDRAAEGAPQDGAAGEPEPPSPVLGVSDSAPEWKRALIDAQGDEA